MTGLLARPRAWKDALAASIVRLGGRGRLEIVERPSCKAGLRLKSPSPAAGADGLPEAELWLLSALRRWTQNPSTPPAWEGWREALGRQAVSEGALTPAEAARVGTISSSLSSFVNPSSKARAARAFAASLEGCPNPEEALPATREDWDEALAYAAALGRTEDFLRRAREVDEFYMRHYQGVVVTLCTPLWFIEDAHSDRDRFAYLTMVLAPLLRRWRWSELEPL